ncbi:MAG: hypothetical protein EA396_12720 [Anaerolineaceae bacterium]|nr:MAG: hypothetical protein EA396_12720 [Anaerolineaceae bacterium]
MTDNDKPKKPNPSRRRGRRGGGRRRKNRGDNPAEKTQETQAGKKKPEAPPKKRRSRRPREEREAPREPSPVELVTGELWLNVVEAQLVALEFNPEGEVNTQLTIAFKSKYPELYAEYTAACDSGDFQPGTALIRQARDGLHVAMLCTQRDKYLGLADDKQIQSAVSDLHAYITEQAISSVTMPPIAAGIGLLNWPRVRRIIERQFTGWDGKIHVYVKADKVERV